MCNTDFFSVVIWIFLFPFLYICRTIALLHSAGVVPDTYISFTNLRKIILNFSDPHLFSSEGMLYRS